MFGASVHREFPFLIASLFSFGLAVAAEAPGLIKLEAPPMYSGCDAWAINNAGVIVGFCWNEEPILGLPVRWAHGAVEVLNGPVKPTGSTEGGDLTPAGGWAVGINDAGEIAGMLYIGNPVRGARAAMWDERGYWRDLGLPAGSQSATARGINSKGDVVGTSDGRAAVFWRDKDIELLPAVNEMSHCSGFAMNNKGEVVGFCNVGTSGETVAILWRNHTAIELANPCGPLDPEEGFMNYARTIGDSGVIGGSAGRCALVWNTSTPQQGAIVAPEGVVNSINGKGQLVGALGKYERLAKWPSRHAAPAELAIPADATGMVRAINDQGKFVGVVHLRDGSAFAFISE